MVEDQLKLFEFFNLYNSFLKAICHVVNEAIQKLIKNCGLNQFFSLILVNLAFPEFLEDLGAVVSVLELRVKHALASELDIYIELNHCVHEEPVYDLRIVVVVHEVIFRVRLYEERHKLQSLGLSVWICYVFIICSDCCNAEFLDCNRGLR